MSGISKREVLGDELYKLIVQDFEAIRSRRKNFKGVPDVYDRAQMKLDKMFEEFYRKIM